MLVVVDRCANIVHFIQQAAKDYMGIDADDESTMYEDSVAPSK